MSKSLGNVLDPFAVIERYGADALRFYLLRDVPFGSDGSVSAAAFEARYENELANEYGNLAARTIAMVHRYRDGVVPTSQLDAELASDFEVLPEQVAALIDKAEVTQALETIWERVRRCNQYVEESAPWTLAKDEANADRLDEVLATLCEALRSLTVLLSPWLPASAEKLLGALGASDESYSAATFGSGSLGAIEKIEPMFPKDPDEAS
jgi:methionyl-tRNA synthetase